MKKILLVSPHYSEYSMQLARALSKNNIVNIILDEKNFKDEIQADPESLSHNNLKIHFFNSRGKIGFISNAINLAKLICIFKPDVIHLQESCPDYIFTNLPLVAYYKTVLTVHDPFPHVGADSRKFKYSRRRFYSFVLRRLATQIIVHGNYLAEQLRMKSPELFDKVKIINHGPLNGFANIKETCCEIGNLLFFGRMHEYKGLSLFINVVELLNKRGLAVKGVIAGAGPDLDNNILKVQNKYYFEVHNRYIPADEIPDFFHRAQLIVTPYIEGTQSGVVAMSLGFKRPVISTRVGSIPELIEKYNMGIVVNHMHVELLADSIQKLICDKEFYDKCSENIRLAIENEISWDNIAARTDDIYCSIS